MKAAKAIIAFCTTLSGATAQVFSDGKVEVAEVVIGLCTVIVATAGVYAFPNQEVS